MEGIVVEGSESCRFALVGKGSVRFKWRTSIRQRDELVRQPSGGITVHRGHCSNGGRRGGGDIGKRGTRSIVIETMVEKHAKFWAYDVIDSKMGREGRASYAFKRHVSMNRVSSCKTFPITPSQSAHKTPQASFYYCCCRAADAAAAAAARRVFALRISLRMMKWRTV